MRRFAAAMIAACIGLPATPTLADEASEQAAANLFDQVSHDPKLLRIFLRSMPKGADLHNHASGAIWAEDYLDWAGAAGFCTDEDGLAVEPPPCPEARRVTALAENDPLAHDRLIDAISTRGVQIGVGSDEQSGHTQFFRSFDRFGSISMQNGARVLASAMRLAAADRVSYLELMHGSGAFSWFALAPDIPLDAAGLEAMYHADMKHVPGVIAQAMAEMDAQEAWVQTELGCNGPAPEPACDVEVHYLASGLRNHTPAQTFRLMILCFEMAKQDPRYLGINFVEPEDWPISLRDYDLHMAMFRFLKAKYPEVRMTLHAGELAFGRVPPADLRDHIAKAIEAGAERIGHGTDIALEEEALATMEFMARNGIAVEINLTSNDVILGVSGDNHPITLYRQMGVPIVLSTDDEGLLRTDMTNEYLRAAREHGLDYRDLKQVARNSLTYSFLPEVERVSLLDRLEEDFERFEKTALLELARAVSPDQHAEGGTLATANK